MVARDTAGLIIPLGLPLLILVMSALTADVQQEMNGMTALDLFVIPVVLVIVVATIGVINMPSFLAMYRRTGVLRRLAVTPASPTMVLAAQTIVSVLQAAVGIALALAVAFMGFGAQPPRDLAAVVGAMVLASAALYSVGLLIAAVAPTPNSAVAMGFVAFLGLGALGGMFGPREALPGALSDLGGWLPFGAAVEAVSNAWAGAAIDAGNLLSLGVTVVLGATVAGLLFRWE